MALSVLVHRGRSNAEPVKLLISIGALTQWRGGLPVRSRARSCELMALSWSLGPALACEDPGLGPGLPLPGTGVEEAEATDDDGIGLDGADDRSLSFCSFSDDTFSVIFTDFMVCWW